MEEQTLLERRKRIHILEMRRDHPRAVSFTGFARPSDTGASRWVGCPMQWRHVANIPRQRLTSR
jgi:hypothetical protein